MSDAVTDTHGLIWYLENDARLGSQARATFEASDQGELTVYIPIICMVEIVYLVEKGRIPPHFKSRLDSILKAGTSGLDLVNLSPAIVDALGQVPRAAVPDMPDRLIAATALYMGLPLISKDSRIHLSDVHTIW